MIDLIDALEEQFPRCDAAPEECVWLWNEDEARAWYASGGAERPATCDEATFTRWFPGLERSRTSCNGRKPRMRVLYFPNAGNQEDMFTSEGTGPRRQSSALLEWCKSNECEVLAVQYPGRANRKSEPYAFDIADITVPLLPVVGPKLQECPFVIIGHSVGSWVAFEFMQLMRSRGMRMPEHVFLSAFPFPDIPHRDRPWHVNVLLDEEAFTEECRRWDVNELVFGPLWEVYHDLMRADFHLFDKYDYAHSGKENFAWPLTMFYGESDRMITREMCAFWETHTTGEFELVNIPGHHLFPLQKDQKAMWLEKIAATLEIVAKRNG